MADPLQENDVIGDEANVYQEYSEQVEEAVPLPKWHPSAVGESGNKLFDLISDIVNRGVVTLFAQLSFLIGSLFCSSVGSSVLITTQIQHGIYSSSWSYS